MKGARAAVMFASVAAASCTAPGTDQPIERAPLDRIAGPDVHSLTVELQGRLTVELQGRLTVELQGRAEAA